MILTPLSSLFVILACPFAVQDEKKAAKTFASRDKERDVSEKIALGQKTAQSKDAMFDQRLFHQAESSAAGFGQEDDYTVYDKPLFKGSSASYIYRYDSSF
jgi:SNW domain-containing protein 1